MRISDPIQVADNTPWDPGPFSRRTHLDVTVFFYSDAAGSVAARLPSSALGVRDGSYVRIECIRAAKSTVSPYVELEARVEGSGTTAIPFSGGKMATIVELGGMSRIEITAARQAPANDAAAAVSYRIAVGGTL